MEFLADLHTKVVHFPIALLITYALLEIIGIVFNKKLCNQSAYILLIIGMVGIFISLLTGNQAFESYKYWDEISSEVLDSHQLYANITTWYFVFITVLRTITIVKKKFSGKMKYIFILFAAIGVFFIFKTGEYGGEMIDKFGIGTEYKNQQMQSSP